MELKLMLSLYGSKTVVRSNRTFMELKYYLLPLQQVPNDVLIAPLWN